MKFTIIVPVFNREQYIKETLKSVINQTYSDWELLCVDDCSTDNGAVLLKTYAEKDARIKIITHQENKGLYLARKTGVQNASGDYILFLDCDDALYLDALATLCSALSNSAVEMLEYGYHSLYSKEDTLPESHITADILFDSLTAADFRRAGTVWNKAYKTALLKKAFAHMSDFYAVMSEDFYESVIIAYYTKSYHSISDRLILYNDESGISNTQKTLAGIKKDLYSIGNIIAGFKTFFKHNASEYADRMTNIEHRFIYYTYYNQILLKMPYKEQIAAVNMLKDCFSADISAPFLKKNAVALRCDTCIYKMRELLKQCIPKTMRMKIKKLMYAVH